MRFVGDRKAWRAIFSDNYPELVAEGFAWPEGPTWLEEEKALIFSDTITGKLHIWKDGAVTLLKEHAGGCAVDVAGGCDSLNNWSREQRHGASWRQDRRLPARREKAGVPGSGFHERGTHC